jgi:hypothetical protein
VAAPAGLCEACGVGWQCGRGPPLGGAAVVG